MNNYKPSKESGQKLAGYSRISLMGEISVFTENEERIANGRKNEGGLFNEKAFRERNGIG